jgi:saccharopine dehydrogenase (NAD+, L-glutamate forming)
VRDFDLVVMGATGFTGGLVADYLAQRGEGIRWAVAGRDRSRLDAVRERMPQAVRPQAVVADSHDPESLEELAARTRVVVTTVGPYVLHGEPLVRACVKAGTHCLDLTGEPLFVHRMRTEYDGPARDQGVRLVSCCGFDSIPTDYGVREAVRRLPAADAPTEVRGYLQAKGAFSGGSWNSALEAFSRWKEFRDAKARRPLPRRERAHRLRQGIHRPPHERGLAVPLPVIDVDVVCRTAESDPAYGTPFRYGHYLNLRGWTQAVALGAGVAGTALGSQLPPVKRWLSQRTPPGSGPDVETRSGSWFRYVFVARRGDAERRVEVRGGDPGYVETAKMLAEAASSLVRPKQALPEAAGVLTPVQAFGDELLERLIAAGLGFREI